ncbi:MAG: putative peptidoglycan-binding protein [Herbinix sp.]|jgi:hypothetical protein|nr:putative peptidoglycan-binding protein [Herbinix sp.]
MRYKSLLRIAIICFVVFMAWSPIKASAAVTLKRGSSGTEVTKLQKTLKEMGYYTYPKITGYYGSITESAVKRFQRDYSISADGKVGKSTRSALYSVGKSSSLERVSIMNTATATKAGSFDWYDTVQYIWKRGMDAVVTDVETGKSFELRRTYGTNHADVEPLTKDDARMIKEIWGGWTWTRRAVIVQVDDYIIAGSMSAMPHAGVDSQRAEKVVSSRSGGYGRGYNLDAVKNNGVSGVMDLHFKNSRNHNTNRVKKAHQVMVTKAAVFIKNMDF